MFHGAAPASAHALQRWLLPHCAGLVGTDVELLRAGTSRRS